MVLAMFVDADQTPLLSALAGGQVFVPPTIIDPYDVPPFARQPTAEFAKGAFYLQQRLAHPVDAVRFQRRMAFYLDTGTAWQPVVLSLQELQRVDELLDPTLWQRATGGTRSRRVNRVARGEAECAAVALARGWTLRSDDAAIIDLLAALSPRHPVERISDLLARAVHEGLLGCREGVDLYNRVFKGMLGLWTTRTLHCQNDQIVVQ